MAVWTHSTWLFFHWLTYNTQSNPYFLDFFTSFNILIPCGYCKNHYNSVLENKNMGIQKNMEVNNLFNWTIDLHSHINKKNHKKLWSYEEARNFYKNRSVTRDEVFDFIRIYHSIAKRRAIVYQNAFITMIHAFVPLIPDKDIQTELQTYLHKNPLHESNINEWTLSM